MTQFEKNYRMETWKNMHDQFTDFEVEKEAKSYIGTRIRIIKISSSVKLLRKMDLVGMFDLKMNSEDDRMITKSEKF
jgi:hypothetical protein